MTEIISCGNPAQFGTTNQQINFGAPSAYVFFNRAVLTDSGTITSISVFAGTAGTLQVGLYSDNSGQPGNLLSNSIATAVTSGSWNTINIPDVPVSGPSTFWLALESQTVSTVAWDLVPSGTNYRQLNSFGTLPSSTSSLETWSYDWSLYANYCLPNGVPSHTPTATRTPTPTATTTPTFTATETAICANPEQFGTVYQQANFGAPSAYVFFNRAILLDTGTITSISVYAGSSGTLQVGLYSDIAGQPGNLLSSSSPTSVSGGGFRTIDITDYPAAGPVTFWIALESKTVSTVAWDIVSSGTHYRKLNTFGNFPSTISSPESWSYDWSLFANYCLPNGVPTHTPTNTRTPTPTATVTPTFTSTETAVCLSPTPNGSYSNPRANYGAPSAYVFFNKFSLASSAKVISVSVFTGTSGTLQVGLYSDTAGQPGNLLSNSSPTSVSGGGWQTIDITDYSAPGPATYWLALESLTVSTVAWDLVTSGTNYRQLNAFGTLPPATSSLETWSYDWSIYANTCP